MTLVTNVTYAGIDGADVTSQRNAICPTAALNAHTDLTSQRNAICSTAAYGRRGHKNLDCCLLQFCSEL